ncbi:MAG: polymerase, sigma-24 subunit, subfamily [Pedosphaera sp.]|nr:polymerase, sigma-24 subunit, subfamily [Pedosphaera sp.]
MDDMELVQEYAKSSSEQAFATLVSRHINLVYSVALRQVGNTHQAQEIAQAVFIILARKAGNLRKGTVLPGWLFQTARLTAGNFLRGEIRRVQREQEAYMQATMQETEPEIWKQIAPLLDSAIADLGEKDRNAILLRFVEGKDLKEVGVALGASEDAAKMRVNRAVEKLRKIFAKRGVVLAGSVLVTAVAANSAQAAPAELAASITAVAALKGAAATTSTLALIKGTLKVMAWTKVKIAVGVGAAVLLATGGITVGLVKASQNGPPVAEIARKTQEKYASLASYRDTGTIQAGVNGQTMPTTTFNTKLGRPGYYRLEWEQSGKTGAVWSAGEGDYLLFSDKKYYQMRDSKTALSAATGVSSGATPVPQIFLNGKSDFLTILAKGKEVARKKDEAIGGVDCYVISCDMDALLGKAGVNASGINYTLWIGKADSLIHQQRQNMKDFQSNARTGGAGVSVKDYSSTVTYANIVTGEPVTKSDFIYNVPADVKLSASFP